MANWIIRSSEYWLKSIYDEMHKQLLTSSIIMSDETVWQVNHENGKKASSKSFIWIHRTGNYEDKPIILYEYTSTPVLVLAIMQKNSLKVFKVIT